MSKHALHQRNMVTALVLVAITCAVATSIFIWRANHRLTPQSQPVATQEVKGENTDGR